MATNNKKAAVTLSDNLLHVSSCPGSHVINLTFGGGGEAKTPVKGVDYFTPDEIEEITNTAAEKAADMVEETYEAEDPIVEFDTVPGSGTQPGEPGNSGNSSGEKDVVEF